MKFMFATTEIHKVPVTVLSRCQRFSLRRVPAIFRRHYGRVAEWEGEAAGGLALIARAADGSVRDGLSLLDRAIALGRADRRGQGARHARPGRSRQVFDLSNVLWGDAAAALELVDRLYQSGADPPLLFQDLLDLGHWLTRIKLAPEAGADDPLAEGDRGAPGRLRRN